MPNQAASFQLTNFNTAVGASQYKAAIDANFSVAARISDIFAPHQGTTPSLNVYLDPGFILSGTSLSESGTRTTATFGSGATTATVANPSGISGTMWVADNIGNTYIAAGTTCTISGSTLTLSHATLQAGTNVQVALGQISPAIVAPVSNPRIDRIVVSAATGSVSVITGTPAGSPVAPALTAGVLPVAQVLMQTSSTAILNTMITDERAFSGSAVNNTEATVASASTTDLGATNVNAALITGTATITSFGSNGNLASPFYRVRFSGACTLTHNGTSLILPGANNIVTIAGDNAVFQATSAGNWKCLEYNRFSGANITTGVAKTVASATTTDIGTAGVNNIIISGTTPITSLGSTATLDSPIYYITFSGALLLTHNASSLILPGIANITTAANDSCVAQLLSSGNWQVISYTKANGAAISGSTYGGATDGGSSGSNLVLTNASNRAQGWTATTFGLSVQLPAANTISSAGGPVFFISNEGTYSFTIIDNAGNIRWILDAGESVTMWLMNNSTSTGVWKAGAQSGLINDLFGVNNSSTVINTAAGSSTMVTMCPLTTTTGFMLYYDATATASWKGVVYTISGEAITFGTPVTLQTQTQVGSNWGSSCVALSSTLVLVSMCENSSNTYVQAVTISGTTVTANTSLSVEAAATSNHYLFFISSTTAYFGYLKNGSNEMGGVQISVSGTTCSAGSIVYGAATATTLGTGTTSICQLSVGSYFYCFPGTTGSGLLACQVFTNSAGTITAHTAVTSQSTAVQKNMVCASPSAGIAIVCSIPASPSYVGVWAFSISSSVITQIFFRINFIPIDVAADGTLFGMPVINPSSLLLVFEEGVSAITGDPWISAIGIKIDPIGGGVTADFKYALPTVVTSMGGLSGTTNIIGPATTLSGKWAIAAIGTSSATSKPQLTYMNAVI